MQKESALPSTRYNVVFIDVVYFCVQYKNLLATAMYTKSIELQLGMAAGFWLSPQL